MHVLTFQESSPVQYPQGIVYEHCITQSNIHMRFALLHYSFQHLQQDICMCVNISHIIIKDFFFFCKDVIKLVLV